ncbi:amidase [Nocardioides sp. LMS-CY]|uniref:amidase n=1 Tax=Nocardioides sp. (strain LMS-CY) TaxID=2840457 RepID=UPI001C0009FB|nr:amidase [Nocardioides sp. LMS-CY]QWF23206.1 amidase [Nocardioides sp. LMS-CY]
MLAALADGVRRGRTTAEDLVLEAAARIESAEPDLGAVTSIDVAAALKRARAIDASGAEHAGPLLGLPLLVKDIENVAGRVTTYGSVPFADAPPAAADSPVVARLTAAGAVVLGRTNTCEFAHEGYTANRLHGATHNPWRPEWSPGGSSGGSAAALAAGLVPLATASDGGGSVRIPASLCGLLGLKPTTGVIGSEPTPAWLDVHTDAVLATCSADLALLLDVMAGPVAGSTAPGPVALAPATPVHQVLAVPRIHGSGELGSTLGADLRDATHRLAAALGEAQGREVRVVDTSIAELFAADDVRDLVERWEPDWYTVTSAEQAQLLGEDVVRRFADAWDPSFAAAMEHGLRVTAAEYLAVRRRCAHARRVLDLALPPGTLLATCVLDGPGYRPDGRAPGHADPGSPYGLTQTVLANLTGHPAISLPAGVSGLGLPWGLQVLAGRWQDRTLLAAADAWERSHPWPRTAPGFAPFDLASVTERS